MKSKLSKKLLTSSTYGIVTEITISLKEYVSLLEDRKQLKKIQGFVSDYYATIPVCKYCKKRHQHKCAFDTG